LRFRVGTTKFSTLFDIACFTNTADEFRSGKKISPSGRDDKEGKIRRAITA
jgi:hypothetical protein